MRSVSIGPNSPQALFDDFDLSACEPEVFEPTPEDWAYLRGDDANDIEDVAFATWVESQGRRFEGGAWDAWLATKLRDLAQTIRWTGATSPTEHDDRVEEAERHLRDRIFQMGFEYGRGAARVSA